MTSKERHEARYQRRCLKRDEKRMAVSRELGDFNDVFSFENLYQAGKNCRKGVNWKASTQAYTSRSIANTSTLYDDLRNNKFNSGNFHEFDIIERGKLRHIKSVRINERVVQRCLCDNYLAPLFTNSFISDNAASQKGKGMDFALNEVNRHLGIYYRRYCRGGDINGYVLLGDFSDFFASAPHSIIYDESERRMHDDKLEKTCNRFMEDFGDHGFGLGSQVSQIDALMVGSPLDHLVKDKLGLRFYGRYMDDFYIIHNDKEYLKACLGEIQQWCDKVGLRLNTKKTRILPLRCGFTFLKTKFTVTETGKIYRRVNKKSAIRMRRKLKTFRRWFDEGRMAIEDIHTSYQSWRGHMKRGNSIRVLAGMDARYARLFPEDAGFKIAG